MTRKDATLRYITARTALLEAIEEVLRAAGADDGLVDDARFQVENTVDLSVKRAETLAKDPRCLKQRR